MNWIFIARCGLFGILWALWQAGSSVYILDSWPTAFTWLKIGSAAAVAFVGGCLTYARDPEAAIKTGPLAKVAVLAAALLAATACATPQVSLPAGAACVAYGNARADYAAAKMLAVQYCKSGKLPAEACETLKQVDVRAQIYRDQVEKALMDPTQPVDWPKVLQYSEEVVGVLLKIAP